MPTQTRYAFAGAANEHSSFMSQVASSQPRQVEKLYESFDYMEFPLANLIETDGTSAFAVRQEFTDERFPPATDILNGAINNAVTAIVVTNVNRFQQYQVIVIDSEPMWVSAITDGTSTLTVTRGGSIGGVSASHLNGATIRIVSTSTPENVPAVASVSSRGDTVVNFMQIFQHALKVSDRQDNAGSYLVGSNKNAESPSKEFAWEVARQFQLVARDIEQASWLGVPFAGSATLPSMMGGIPSYITTNVTDVAGQPFTDVQVMDLLQLAWGQVGPNNIARLIFSGPTARRALSSFFKQNVQMRPTDRKASLVVDEIETDLGTLELAEANYWIPPTLVACIDPANYKYRNWAGYGAVHKSNLAIDGAYQKGAITADKGLICGGDRCSWKITSVSVVASDYPTLS
jgi:hypothetical protein